MSMDYIVAINKEVKYPYSKSSLEKLIGVHPLMVDFAFKLADIIDCKLVSGVRFDEEQYELFLAGKSTRDGITKKSDHQPKEDGYGYALDILPLPVGVNMYLDDGIEDNIRWGQFDGLCQGVAHGMGIQVKTGFKWGRNMMDSLARAERDNTFPDGNHVGLIV